MDPYEFSYRLIEEHADTLAVEARALLEQNPDALPVGLVLDAEVAAVAEVQDALRAAGTSSPPGHGFVGVVQRETALAILRMQAPAALDWLEENREGPLLTLPVVALIRGGCRLGSVALGVGE
jgi:hypothetical protein